MPKTKYWNAIVWYATGFVCLCLQWWLIKFNLGIEYPNTIGTFLKCIGDVAIVMMPYWLLAPKWRWTALIPVWLFSIFGIVNLVYYRFWGDLVLPASVTMAGNVNGNLMEYGFSLMCWNDLFFLIVPLFACLVCLFMNPGISISFSSKIKILFVVVSLLIGAVGQYSYFKSVYNWRYSNYGLSMGEAVFQHYFGVYNSPIQLYNSNGPVYYCFRYVNDIFEVWNSSIDLTTEQVKEIDHFIENYTHLPEKNRTVFSLDTINVVYIIVESLNSDMLNKTIGGMKIMPFLDSLANTDGTILFDNVVSQTKASSSSDGHLLLMTGLLPPEKISYSISYGSKNTFPSIADVLPDHHKYLLLADDGICWNEGNTLRQFGLGHPLVEKDRPQFSIKDFGRDGALFRHATEIIKTAAQPFFMTMMTISMHIPFKEEAWPVPEDIENAVGISRFEKDYANMCHNFDSYLSEFVSSLPENTLIFIASDHSQNLASDGKHQSTGMFMAVNSGRTAHISRTVGQVNIFPATLEILGRYNGYGGLAPSAFDPSVDGTMDSYGNIFGNPSQTTLDTLRKAYEISDLIIRSDYFGK